MTLHAAPLDFCVLIPCYNDEAGLVQALKSIQYPFELCLAVVVDDGSRKPLDAGHISAQVGTSLQLHLITLGQNKGITAALNAGLQWIITHTSAPYIARLDCRDVCQPERFYEQVAYLNKHAEVGLLGTWCRFKDDHSSLMYDYTTPVAHKQIEKTMHLRNVFIHPTVMFRSVLVKQGVFYPEAYPHAEDYAFFWRLLQITRGAILPRFLVTCAITRTGISYQHRQAQLQSRRKVVQAFGKGGWVNRWGLIKIYLLMVLPKALLLRLKGLRYKK